MKGGGHVSETQNHIEDNRAALCLAACT